MTAITITDAAHDYLADLLSKQNTPGIGIRVFITQPGTQYAETCIAYCKPGEEKPEDTALGLKSFTASIDAFSEAFLDDAVVDYATDRMGGQLTIKAPNAKVPNVNADSPVNERINYYLQTEINPGLASHGGQVSLIDVVEDGIAVLKFGGGCQGCGQADVTLREGIERTLLERIPELKGVRDVTDHTQKENAYYGVRRSLRTKKRRPVSAVFLCFKFNELRYLSDKLDQVWERACSRKRCVSRLIW